MYKKEHQDAISEVFPEFSVPVLRKKFRQIAEASLHWVEQEIEICRPKLIITLGEEVARVVSGQHKTADELLTVNFKNPERLNKINTIYAPHPDACRRSEKWRKVMRDQIRLIRNLELI